MTRTYSAFSLTVGLFAEKIANKIDQTSPATSVTKSAFSLLHSLAFPRKRPCHARRSD